MCCCRNRVSNYFLFASMLSFGFNYSLLLVSFSSFNNDISRVKAFYFRSLKFNIPSSSEDNSYYFILTAKKDPLDFQTSWLASAASTLPGMAGHPCSMVPIRIACPFASCCWIHAPVPRSPMMLVECEAVTLDGIISMVHPLIK